VIHEPLSYTTAFIVGLLGSAHCIGMCGGIMNALSFAIPDQHKNTRQVARIIILYNLGRITSYAIAGALIGLLGTWLQQTGGPAALTLRTIAGLMLIAMGLYLGGWWFGLTYVEKLGGYVWKYLKPLGNYIVPVTRPSRAAALGMLWGWLPCGLVYSILVWSATSSGWQQSTIIMFCFGLGTMPSMLLTGLFAHQLKQWSQQSPVRTTAAVLVIGFGVWTLAMPRPNTTDYSYFFVNRPRAWA
jgi:sulfite exporter TauE/SafE